MNAIALNVILDIDNGYPTNDTGALWSFTVAVKYKPHPSASTEHTAKDLTDRQLQGLLLEISQPGMGCGVCHIHNGSAARLLRSLTFNHNPDHTVSAATRFMDMPYGVSSTISNILINYDARLKQSPLFNPKKPDVEIPDPVSDDPHLTVSLTLRKQSTEVAA